MSDAPPTANGARGRILVALGAGGWTSGPVANAALLAGAGLVVWSAIIHLHLWDTGYRSIATIGPLFLMQGIVGIVLAAVLALVRRVWMALILFGFAASTIGGFLLSVNVGLFGFRDSWSAPFATEAFGLEVASLVVLVLGAALCAWRAPALRRRAVPRVPAAASPSG